jgi:hypothetical protein
MIISSSGTGPSACGWDIPRERGREVPHPGAGGQRRVQPQESPAPPPPQLPQQTFQLVSGTRLQPAVRPPARSQAAAFVSLPGIFERHLPPGGHAGAARPRAPRHPGRVRYRGARAGVAMRAQRKTVMWRNIPRASRSSMAPPCSAGPAPRRAQGVRRCTHCPVMVLPLGRVCGGAT